MVFIQPPVPVRVHFTQGNMAGAMQWKKKAHFETPRVLTWGMSGSGLEEMLLDKECVCV